jgi:hypothetical protein
LDIVEIQIIKSTLPLIQKCYQKQPSFLTLRNSDYPCATRLHRNRDLQRALQRESIHVAAVARTTLSWLESNHLPEMLIEMVLWHIPIMCILTLSKVRRIIKNVQTLTHQGKLPSRYQFYDVKFGYFAYPDEFISWLNDTYASPAEKPSGQNKPQRMM